MREILVQAPDELEMSSNLVRFSVTTDKWSTAVQTAREILDKFIDGDFVYEITTIDCQPEIRSVGGPIHYWRSEVVAVVRTPGEQP